MYIFFILCPPFVPGVYKYCLTLCPLFVSGICMYSICIVSPSAHPLSVSNILSHHQPTLYPWRIYYPTLCPPTIPDVYMYIFYPLPTLCPWRIYLHCLTLWPHIVPGVNILSPPVIIYICKFCKKNHVASELLVFTSNLLELLLNARSTLWDWPVRLG